MRVKIPIFQLAAGELQMHSAVEPFLGPYARLMIWR